MRIVYVEPFEGGSHASFTQTLTSALDAQWTKLTLPGRHWKWRMRGSAVWAARAGRAAFEDPPDLLFASSYLPLAELVGLVPSLGSVPRVLYFHENQLAFPSAQPPAERDHHFGFTQLVSALAATRCVFNSQHNLDTFVEAGRALLSAMPDAVPSDWIDEVVSRSLVVPVPVRLAPGSPRPAPTVEDRAAGPIILWNHRWEFDKNPEGFFSVLRRLASRDLPFRVAICGQRFSRAPEVFERGRAELGPRVVHFGFVEDRAAYLDLLGRADIVVSTAIHEFFGISMIEAAHHGAAPLVPDRLSYPEIFPPERRYRDEEDLLARLIDSCRRHAAGESIAWSDSASLQSRFGVAPVVARYRALFESLVVGRDCGLAP